MLYPRLASIASFWLSEMYWINSLAAGMFFENFQIAHTLGSPTFHRPPGPATSGTTKVCSKTLGLVRRVEWKAEIASWIQLATPEARKRLSEASSHENTSGVMPSSYSALPKRSDSRISLESIKMFCPLGSVSLTPKQYMRARQLWLASLQCENCMPVGCPLALSCPAAFLRSSQVFGSPIPIEAKRSLRHRTGIEMKKSGTAYQTPLTCAALFEASSQPPYFLPRPSATSERSTRLR